MKIQSERLLNELLNDLLAQQALVQQLSGLNDAQLNYRSSETSWSALECVAHLNSYARYYLPQFDLAISKSQEKGWKASTEFKGTWLGRYCIKSVLPENRKAKLKSPSQHNKIYSSLDRHELDAFVAYLEEQKQVLQRAGAIDLNKTKVAIEIMPWLKLRLGDFLPFLIKHQSRHMAQALEAAGLYVEDIT